MDPKNQLTSSNDYTPSPRASAAVRTAQSGRSGAPDHADSGSVAAPAGADQPRNQRTGGKIVNNTQKGDASYDTVQSNGVKVEKG